jgi:hypothetical protein
MIARQPSVPNAIFVPAAIFRLCLPADNNDELAPFLRHRSARFLRRPEEAG